VTDEAVVLKADLVQPGDVVILSTEQVVSSQQADEIKQRLCDRLKWLKPEDVIVLSGINLSVVRKSS
jgi:hypothetical protein